MTNPTDDEIAGQLGLLISDGFNRSLRALVQAGAVDTTRMKKYYTGVGSKFYDLVTEQINLTARYGAPGVRQLFSSDRPTTSPDPAANQAELAVARRCDASPMRRAPGLWNLARVALIVFCGYQLMLAALASQLAERTVKMPPPPGEPQETITRNADAMEAAGEVLHGHTGSTLYYVGFLVILALSPYAAMQKPTS